MVQILIVKTNIEIPLQIGCGRILLNIEGKNFCTLNITNFIFIFTTGTEV